MTGLGSFSRSACWIGILSGSLLVGRRSSGKRKAASWVRKRRSLCGDSLRSKAQLEQTTHWDSIRSPQNAKLKLVRHILRRGSLPVDTNSGAAVPGRSGDSSSGFDGPRMSSAGAHRRQYGPGLRPVQFVVEGARLLQDALEAHWTPEFILCAADLVTDLWHRQPKLMSTLSEEPVLRERTFLCETPMPSDTVQSQGILGVFQRQWVPWNPKSNLLLYLDAVQDPGNLGTIMRSACASGTYALLLSAHCVDVWSTKAVRAGMGAHFRQCIVDKLQLNELESVIALASAAGEASLQNNLEPGGSVSPSLPTGEMSTNKTAGRLRTPFSYRFIIGHHRKVDGLPHFLYDDWAVWDDAFALASMRSDHLVAPARPIVTENTPPARFDILVIGNEAHGPSAAVFELARHCPGSCTVAIPLESGVESLNAAAAASVLLFEAQRHRRNRVIHANSASYPEP